MSHIEVIERLCAVTKLQADIIQKQNEVIEQAKIADALTEDLQQMRTIAQNEVALIGKEYN